MDENNINEFLDYIESTYFIYDDIFNYSPNDFLDLGERFITAGEIIEDNIPVSVLEMLEV